jgi:tetrathionate reductase subunit B
MDEDRRAFLMQAGKFIALTGAAALAWDSVLAGAPEQASNYATTEHWWGMIIDIDKCIGCGNCVRACKAENNVLNEPGCFRTWVERYQVHPSDMEHPIVDSPNGGYDGFTEVDRPGEGTKVFFVPKLCNHCVDSPCTQVCPVGATFHSPDQVVLIDKKRCIGCGYCVQACPYGCRYIAHPPGTADKCTLCYHRIHRGQATACVEACPRDARICGNLKDPQSRIRRLLHERRYSVLKPELATSPKCYCIGLDLEVK